MTEVAVQRVPFYQVDVFAAQRFRGNPVAVIFGAEGLATEAMQRIANWTNLSETTFVLPPTHAGADYRLRIFDPRHELPFAGHPTLGSAWAYCRQRAAALPSTLVQECAKGLVPLRVDGAAAGIDSGRLSFRLPEVGQQRVDEASVAELAAALGVAPLGPVLNINAGPLWMTARLPDRAQVLQLQPDFGRIAALSQRLHGTGVTVFAEDSSGDVEVRSFAPADGVLEDPVCGSGNGAVAAYRWSQGWRRSYHAAQGACLGRKGEIEVRYETDGAIWIGGQVQICVRGELSLGE